MNAHVMPPVGQAKGSQILISNGKLVDPFDLQDEDIDVPALCRSMSMLNRYTGHTIAPYSVAEHTVHLANKVPVHLKRAALVHDMSEPLCNDIPRPIKRKLPEFVQFEEIVQRRLFQHFGIDWELMEELHQYDYRICQDEMMQLFTPPYNIGVEPLGVKIQCWPWYWACSNLVALCKEHSIV